MKQAEFESTHRSFWQAFEETVKELSKDEDENLSSFPEDYRKVCQHLAIANSRGYAANIVAYLNTLVQQGYRVLYGNQVGRGHAFLNFIFVDFQATLRANSKFV